ncbi:D-alanyl-D-alanine carboxypeptidase family protein [Microbacterium sp. NIBRBAC000506063]|uniref:M15 family metallopeptidase n=1 Tax=Microbacterium sp. NIBRBAC000506063 TaxID=2734618 RepID=UPI001BB4F012|nr:M15 family metallopeptidase [Microbacterium sp. NIBRBAC000506063]QTV80161.1 M15 family metallopeptidase [Microbacterium sp. NIBRBAC000506063]
MPPPSRRTVAAHRRRRRASAGRDGDRTDRPGCRPALRGFLTALGPSIDVYDIDDPASLTVVVNKQRPLDPIDWAPSDLTAPRGIPNPHGQPLRAAAVDALEALYAEARDAGIRLHMISGYRSHRLQSSVFRTRVSTYGEHGAEQRSARPGHSEHQTGLAVDFDDGSGCELRECFGETKAGRWLRENAHRFGFILRYDHDTEGMVGYQYEPWHFRYVGVEIAADMHEHAIGTLEEYFGLPEAPDY